MNKTERTENRDTQCGQPSACCQHLALDTNDQPHLVQRRCLQFGLEPGFNLGHHDLPLQEPLRGLASVIG